MLLSGYHVRINMLISPRTQTSAARAAARWRQDEGLRPSCLPSATGVAWGAGTASATAAVSGGDAFASPWLLFAFQQVNG